MKVETLTKEQLSAEMKKTLKVRAVGDPDIFVGYYNHIRRRGGDVFILTPVIRDRDIPVLDKEGNPIMIHDPIYKREVPKKIKKRILITAERQFSERWMELVDAKIPTNLPKHFNEVGRGRKRFDIPGMTNKVGTNEQNVMRAHNQREVIGNDEGSEFDLDNEPTKNSIPVATPDLPPVDDGNGDNVI